MKLSPKIALLAGSALFAAQHTYAVDAPSTATLEEIVVTAQKRTELAKDVPASISAVTATKLQDISAAKLDDYVQLLPAVTISNVSAAQAGTQITIRGVTTGAGGNPTVGIYVDDSPFGTSTNFGGYTMPDLDPQDLARVEVLRGPQGTLYGAGSMGGLLKYVTADPDPSHLFGRVSVDGSTTAHGGTGWGVRGGVNLPLGDKFALRVSGYDRRDPGYIDNVTTGSNDVNETDVYGGRVALGWFINEDWKAKLSGVHQYQDGAGPIVEYNVQTFKPLYGELQTDEAYNSNGNTQKLQVYSLDVEGKLGDFATFTSATAYDRQDMHLAIDYTALLTGVVEAFFGIPNAGVSLADRLGIDKFTQEFRLTSPEQNTLSWLVGAFYTHEQTRVVVEDPVFNKFTGDPITGLPSFLTGGFNAKFKEQAVFGDLTYHITPTFDITGGIRYSRNDQRTLTNTGGILVPPVNTNIKSSDSSTTYLITPRWRPTERTMIYARVATGYRPGGPNTGIGGTPLSYAPDKVTNYEIGIKTDLLDRTLSLDAAAYWIKWKDIQVQQVGVYGSFIGNGSAAVSRGAEASIQWRPIAPLTLFGNLAYQDAYVTQDFPAGGALASNGDRLPLTPEWSGTVGGEYVLPLFSMWKGRIGGDWHYTGHTEGAFSNAGVPRFQRPSYDIVNLHVGVSSDRWTFLVYGKNLGDARAQGADLNLGPITRVTIQQPRTIGVSLSANF